MGVSIRMTPGPIGRNFGKQIDITPGRRSQAAAMLRARFGEAPFSLVQQHDFDLLRIMEAGASIYVADAENMWKQIADALMEYGVVTITLEY